MPRLCQIYTMFCLLLIGLCACQVPTSPHAVHTPTPKESIPVVFPTYSRRILFSAAGDLHIMHANGAGRQNLTPHTPSQETMPAWSPDGAYIAFVSNREGNEEVYIVPASAPGDVAAQINISQHPAQDHSPAWSANGKQIAFTSNRESSWSICVVDLSSNTPLPANPVLAGPIRYTHNARYDGHPAWSPDRVIAFSHDDGYRWRVSQMQGNGAPQQIIGGTEVLAGALHPHWSPDGTRVVLSGLLDDNWDIYSVDILTGELHQLTTHPSRDWWPRWSPDGQYITFVSERSGNGDIYLINVASTEVLRLTDSPATEMFPAWEP